MSFIIPQFDNHCFPKQPTNASSNPKRSHRAQSLHTSHSRFRVISLVFTAFYRSIFRLRCSHKTWNWRTWVQFGYHWELQLSEIIFLSTELVKQYYQCLLNTANRNITETNLFFTGSFPCLELSVIHFQFSHLSFLLDLGEISRVLHLTQVLANERRMKYDWWSGMLWLFHRFATFAYIWPVFCLACRPIRLKVCNSLSNWLQCECRSLATNVSSESFV